MNIPEDLRDHVVNVVLTFVDQDGNEWLAGAVMMPLQRADEVVPLNEVPDRAFALKGFRVVV
jgi:hypothetical protein